MNTVLATALIFLLVLPLSTTQPTYAGGRIVYNIVVNVYAYEASLNTYVPYMVFEMNLPVHITGSGGYAVDASSIRVIVHSVSGPVTRREVEKQAYAAAEIVRGALINWSRRIGGAEPVSHEYLLVAGRIILAYKTYIDGDTVLYDEKTHVILGGRIKRVAGQYMYVARMSAYDADNNLAASMNTVEPPSSSLLLSASSMILLALLVMIGNNLSKWEYYAIS